MAMARRIVPIASDFRSRNQFRKSVPRVIDDFKRPGGGALLSKNQFADELRIIENTGFVARDSNHPVIYRTKVITNYVRQSTNYPLLDYGAELVSRLKNENN